MEECEFAQHLIEKLRTNASLTGEERKYVMDMINCHDDAQDSNDHHSKGIQVVMRNVQNARVQTDSVDWRGAATSTSKKSRNQHLLQVSFDDRRIFIIVKNPSILAIQNQYPDLFSTQEIRNELDRIFYPGKSEEFLNHISKYSGAIFESSNSKKLRSITEVAMEKAEREPDRNYALQVGAILMLPEIMVPNPTGEPVRFLKFQMQDPYEECYPYIYTSSNDIKELYVKNRIYRIIVEGSQVGETYNFLEAVLVYFSCFFIFNIVYSKDDFNTLVAMERLFLNGRETEEVDDYASEKIKDIISNAG